MEKGSEIEGGQKQLDKLRGGVRVTTGLGPGVKKRRDLGGRTLKSLRDPRGGDGGDLEHKVSFTVTFVRKTTVPARLKDLGRSTGRKSFLGKAERSSRKRLSPKCEDS